MRIVRTENVEFDIIGDGTLRPELETKAMDSGARVRFLGVIDHHELPDLLCEYQVFLLPSKREGLPKALLEAMSCGLACIGFPTDGVKILLTNEKTGFICQGRPEHISEAIIRCKDDRLRKELGKNARGLMLAEYDLEKLLSRETDLLAEICGGS